MQDEILLKDIEHVHRIIHVKSSFEFKIFNCISFWIRKFFNRSGGKLEDGYVNDAAVSQEKWLQRFLLWLMTKHFLIERKLYAKSALKTLRHATNDVFDVVFSTFGPINNLFAGMAYKKKNPKCIWIADFRDHIYSETVHPLSYKKYTEKLMTKTENSADISTAVSLGCLKALGAENSLKAHVVTNGFDEDDLVNVPEYNNHINKKFTLAYTGAVYKERKFDMLFDALRRLIDEGKIDKADLCLNYAGGYEQELMKQAKQFDLESIIKGHGFIPRKESLLLQMQSHLLILLSQNSQLIQGAMTGKVFEYMMINRPIVAVIEGDVPNSELAQVIKNGNFGICCERADKNDVDKLKTYLLSQYKHFKNGEPIDYNPDLNYRYRFSYEYLSKRIVKLIEQVK
ncbi:MAG: glycosyltransferase [Oscillospiraceae bacterium]